MQHTQTSAATLKLNSPSPQAPSTSSTASPAPTPTPTYSNNAALPELARKVTPQDHQLLPTSNMDSISTVAASAIPLATEPGYQDHLAQQDQDHLNAHYKHVRFDTEPSKLQSHSQLHPKPSSSIAMGMATSHCGVSKRGRYVSPGRRAFTSMPDISHHPSVNTDSSTAATANENQASHLKGETEPAKDLLMSPKSTDTKAFIATTPTDFTVDFGSTPSKQSGAFDTSNVLAWLSSPGFFSPGFSSPNAKNCSRTSTPIVSTSFFFSDVANLPKGGGENNIICISPLAASKMTPGESWKEVFASPPTRISGKSVLSDKPSPKGMDAVLAERDVREDEDLSVLLKLASTSTPRSGRKHPDARKSSDPPVLPTMQDSGKVRLSQKKDQRTDSFTPPSLGMRTNSKRGADQAFPFQPSSDYYGSMRVSIGGGKGPPSPKQQQPYPYQMFAAYYQQPNAPYTHPQGYTQQQQPPPEASPAPKPRKKSRQSSIGDKGEDDLGSVSSASKTTATTPSSTTKRRRSPNKKKNKSPQIAGEREREKAAAAIKTLNVASGGKNDRAAALAAAILRGVTQRPSGKWQAQLYFAGKSRYIGVFDSREKAALAYEIAREKLKEGAATAESTEALVNEARKAAFDGVNEQLSHK